MNGLANQARPRPAANASPRDFVPPPCFFNEQCTRSADLEKAGRSVCRPCAKRLRGVEYPLRPPTAEPLYLTGRAAAEALDMLED